MNSGVLAAALFCFAAPASAQLEPNSVDAPESDPAIIAVRNKLSSDPALADAVAARLAKSRLIAQITAAVGGAERTAAAREWIAQDPAAAARVALGLAQDDQSGSTGYEDALLKQLHTTYGANPGAEKNIFFRLRKSANESKLLKRQAEDLSEDERRELLRTLFEGKGTQSAKVLNAKDDGRVGDTPRSAGGVTSFNGFYNRLSALNLNGYSPQLLALQSSLNAHRPPGAPALVETGKLDEATLSFPTFAMNFDVVNLEARLASDLSGTAPGAKMESGLDATAARTARLQRRKERVAKARAAAAAFESAASRAKNPAAVTRELLLELSRRQQEAARWITAAALEEELSRSDAVPGFLTPELLAAIAVAPAPPPAREAYKRRGFELQADLDLRRAGVHHAQDVLESAAWTSRLAEVDRLVAENRTALRGLLRFVDEYSSVPFQLVSSGPTRPRWRILLENLAMRWTPRTDFAREATQRRSRYAGALESFMAIAAGARGSRP